MKSVLSYPIIKSKKRHEEKMRFNYVKHNKKK